MTPVLAVIFGYLSIVFAIGFLGHRLFRGTGEDYFLASRTIGSFVLLMTLFGTHMTAFTILGASGEAHLRGIGVFALMGSSSALIAPLVFYFVGTRLWWLGKRHGYLTQVQFFRDRYQSDGLGLLLFFVLIGLLVPYVLIGVKGGGDVLNALTGGAEKGLPNWVGSLLMCGVIFSYVSYGGMRSTAWANTFQTIVFMTVGCLAFYVVVGRYGGLGMAMETLYERNPELVRIGWSRQELFRMGSYLLVPLSAGVFPHIFGHCLSARSAHAFRATIVLYPIFIAVVWFSSVVLGLLGHIDFPPPIQGPVLVHLILDNSGGLLAGLLAAGVFAAIMSSLDSQTLAAGTIFTQDIVHHYGFNDGLSERKQVLFGRLLALIFLAAVFVLAMVTSRSIFSVGVWSLSGFAGLFPIVVAALYWRRSTAAGVIGAIVTVGGLWILFFLRGLETPGEYTVGGSGIMPVAFLVAGATVSIVILSLVTRPPDKDVVERFFP